MPSASAIQAGERARQVFLLGRKTPAQLALENHALTSTKVNATSLFDHVASIVFDNKAFWTTLAVSAEEYDKDPLCLGSRYNDPSYLHVPLGRLHRLLSVSRSIRGQLLEFPSTVALSNAVVPYGRALESQRRLRRKSKLEMEGGEASSIMMSPVLIDRAEALLFVQPQSILDRAVKMLVGYYDPQRPGLTTMYAIQASKRFGFTLESMQALRTGNNYLPPLILEDGEDANFAARDAALNASRIPFLQVLLLLLLCMPKSSSNHHHHHYTNLSKIVISTG